MKIGAKYPPFLNQIFFLSLFKVLLSMAFHSRGRYSGRSPLSSAFRSALYALIALEIISNRNFLLYPENCIRDDKFDMCCAFVSQGRSRLQFSKIRSPSCVRHVLFILHGRAEEACTTDFDDTSFTSATFTARYAQIYRSDGSAPTNNSVLVLDFGGDFTATSGTFTIQFPSAGTSTAVLRLA